MTRFHETVRTALPRLPSELIRHYRQRQGDEPLIEPAMIDEAIRPLVDDETIVMGTLKSRVRDLHDFLSPNVVKVITDCNGFALYFSRSPLPFFRDKWNDLKDEALLPAGFCYKHVGMYVYRRDFLIRFAGMPQTYLERAEKLNSFVFWKTVIESRWSRRNTSP
jgi:3-deoxy-manno-octulosonate cytidylyltransferase (CMP-KDO synthetase)